MYEASSLLYNYIKEKYKNNNAVVINNLAISDTEQTIQFNEESIIYQIENNASYFNFGLSHITCTSSTNSYTSIQSQKISNIIKDNNEIINNVSFIKIDTENTDFKILEDLSTVINLFKIKPVIEFEVNYLSSNHTKEKAQNILDLFALEGYHSLNIEECSGDGILIPLL
jgi:FkbM family methyltransferase